MSGEGPPFAVRETLDLAVRALALSTGDMRDRLYVPAVLILGRLSRSDFGQQEDRELFDEVRVELTRLRGAAEEDSIALTVEAMSEQTATRMAGKILDLRDAAIGRAIARLQRDARNGQRPVPEQEDRLPDAWG